METESCHIRECCTPKKSSSGLSTALLCSVYCLFLIKSFVNCDQARPRILNGNETHDILTLLTESPELYLDEIMDWIAITQDKEISRSALHELIRDAGITHKLLRKAASERDEKAREDWRVFMVDNLLASMVVTVDETSKDDRTIFRRYGRAPKGSRAEIEANFVRGERYSLVAALTVEGFIGSRVVSGSVNSDEFFDFIVHDIVSHLSDYLFILLHLFLHCDIASSNAAMASRSQCSYS